MIVRPRVTCWARRIRYVVRRFVFVSRCVTPALTTIIIIIINNKEFLRRRLPDRVCWLHGTDWWRVDLSGSIGVRMDRSIATVYNTTAVTVKRRWYVPDDGGTRVDARPGTRRPPSWRPHESMSYLGFDHRGRCTRGVGQVSKPT